MGPLGFNFPCPLALFFRPNGDKVARTLRAPCPSSSVIRRDLLLGNPGLFCIENPAVVIKHSSTNRKSYRNWGSWAGRGAQVWNPHYFQVFWGPPSFPFHPHPQIIVGTGCTLYKADKNTDVSFFLDANAHCGKSQMLTHCEGPTPAKPSHISLE